MKQIPLFSCASGFLTLFLTGCASVSPQDAFQPVESDVLARSGHRVVWNQGTADDQKADAAVHRLLLSPLGADAAVQIALLNNPDLQATFEDIGISQADLVQAGLIKNPTFAASWRFPDVGPGFTDAEYALAQDFLSIIIRPLKIKIAKADLDATQDRVSHEVIRLVAEVKEAFYTFQADLQLEERLKLIIQSDQAAVDLAKAQHDSGNINDASYLNQQGQLAIASLALSNAAKQKIAAREKLDRLMGLWGEETVWQVRPNLPNLPDHDPSLEHLETLAINQRRDLSALRRDVASIGQMLALKTNTRYLPGGVTIGVDTEKVAPDQSVTGPTLDLELPIFDQGQGAIARLAAEYRLAQRRLQSLAIRIRSDVRESRDMLKIDRDQVAFFKKVIVPLNIRLVNQTLLQYNAMQTNTYDLFLAKQRELDTEQEYVSSWRDYWISRAKLEETVGGSLRPMQPQPKP